MSGFWWILIFFAVIAIGYGLFFLFLFAMALTFSAATSPTKPEDSIATVKRFLGYDFGDKYTLSEYESNNLHGDRPLKFLMNFTEDDFQKILSFLENLNFNEDIYYNDDKSVIYKDKWDKGPFIDRIDKNSVSFVYTKSHKAFHQSNEDYCIFFSASLYFDIDKRTLRYSETGF